MLPTPQVTAESDGAGRRGHGHGRPCPLHDALLRGLALAEGL
ncbi:MULTISPECIES: hypothetical protein [Streptomyces]|nr:MULTISPECIES: hypothetical protein [Streptomyces]WUB39458.1 hypothetical protein OHN38_32780 [Streptomyces sp. NBC_00588]